jgi:hypothetical protein
MPVDDMNCECAKFEPIELYREAVSKRIKQTKKLKHELETIATHNLGEHRLLRCRVCGQHWQLSRAWNWGNPEYLFAVPKIDPDQWLIEPYVQPDELLIYSAVMHDYMERCTFVQKEEECRAVGCTNRAVRFSVFCLEDHIISLQNASVLPKLPQGRWFAPYRSN